MCNDQKKKARKFEYVNYRRISGKFYWCKIQWHEEIWIPLEECTLHLYFINSITSTCPIRSNRRVLSGVPSVSEFYLIGPRTQVFSYLTPTLWILISSEVKLGRTLMAFRKVLKTCCFFPQQVWDSSDIRKPSCWLHHV